MFITEERHTIFYSNPVMWSGWLEVQVIWSDGDYPMIPHQSYDGTFWSRFNNGLGYLDEVFKNMYMTCNPSVRSEVERAFETYLSYCGIGRCSVIKESHDVYVKVNDEEYIINFEGVPGQGKVQCSVSRGDCSSQVWNIGMMSIDVKSERELLRCAWMVQKGIK